MRVRTAGCREDALGCLNGIAPGSRLDADDIVVPGPPSLRPAALEAIRAAGVVVLGLTADEGRLDALYRELIGEPT
jgi:Cu-processing system ATP-binding protein